MPFSKPSIAPKSEEQISAFEDLEEMLDDGRLSSAIGWIIRQKEVLGDKQLLKAVRRQLVHSMEGRCLTNWTVVVHAAIEVRTPDNRLFIISHIKSFAVSQRSWI